MSACFHNREPCAFVPFLSDVGMTRRRIYSTGDASVLFCPERFELVSREEMDRMGIAVPGAVRSANRRNAKVCRASCTRLQRVDARALLFHSCSVICVSTWYRVIGHRGVQQRCQCLSHWALAYRSLRPSKCAVSVGSKSLADAQMAAEVRGCLCRDGGDVEGHAPAAETDERLWNVE